MPVKPTFKQLQSIAETHNLQLSEEDMVFFHTSIGATLLPSYNRLDQLSEPALPVKYLRAGSYRPTSEENSLNAWYQKCSICEHLCLSGEVIQPIQVRSAIHTIPSIQQEALLVEAQRLLLPANVTWLLAAIREDRFACQVVGVVLTA